MLKAKSGLVWIATLLLGAAIPLARAAHPPGDLLASAKRAGAGDAEGIGQVEQLIDPFFSRKDVWSLDAASGAREAAKVAGAALPAGSIRWFVFGPDGPDLRLLTIDFGMPESPGIAGKGGYVAYAIVEAGGDGSPAVSWYHDLGRKLSEQQGEAWHPVAAERLDAGAGDAKAVLAISCAERPDAAPSGVMLLENRGGAWSAARRIAPSRGALLLGTAREGVVFLMKRDAPKGVLTGASPDLFRAIALYDRDKSGFTLEPAVAAVPDVVTTAEAVIAALRRGDKEGAARLCASPDVVDQMLYFTPGWKGGGKVISAGPNQLEFVYSENERPTLRIQLTFQNRAGVLLIASASGRSEPAKP